MRRCRKSRTGKWMVLVSLICLMSFVVCGCESSGGSVEKSDSGQSQSVQKPEDSKEEQGSRAGKPKEQDAVPEESPDFTGDIKEIKGQEFTAIESKTEEDGNGGEIMVNPSTGGDDSDFNKVQVSYGENTAFSIRTIYDGGKRYEDAEAQEKDLAEGMSVNVWGERSEDTLKAEAVQIIKVVF